MRQAPQVNAASNKGVFSAPLLLRCKIFAAGLWTWLWGFPIDVDAYPDR
jgi:hypothetical protein